MANSAVVGMLRAILQLDTAEFEAGGKRAVTAADNIGKSLTKTLAPGAKSVETSFGSAIASVKGFAASLGVGLSIGALLGFGREMLSTASRIQDLSDRMGISAEAAQRFAFAAEQTGSSLESVSRSITFMNRVLGEGDKSTKAALKQAGLSFDEIRRMKPEDAFLSIAAAVGKMADPMAQTTVMVKLFGRTATELLPAIRSNFAELAASAVVASNESIKALDGFSDALARLATNAKNLSINIAGGLVLGLDTWREIGQAFVAGFSGMSGSIVAQNAVLSAGLAAQRKDIDLKRETTKTVIDLTDEQKKYLSTITAMADAWSNEAIQKKITETSAALKNFEARGLTPAREGMTKLVKQIGEWMRAGFDVPENLRLQYLALITLDVAMPKATEGMQGLTFATVDGTKAFRESAEALTAWVGALNKVTQSGSLGAEAITGLVRGLPQLEPFKLPAGVTTALDIQLRTLFQGAVSQLPQTILSALTGGGNVAGSIGGLFGGQLTKGLGASIGTSLSGVLGKTLGGAIGSIIPGIGTLLGSGLGALIGKIFGPTEAMKTNDVRDAWMAQMGGLQKLQKMIGAFGNDPVLMSTFQRLYSTGKQQEFQTAAEAFERRMRELMGEREDAQARLTNALQKYGFTIDELGPKWKAQQLTDQAKELVLDYTALVASGIDVGTVIERMGTAFNEYVQLAKKAGVEIPLEMKPMIEKMIEMGLLTDENGVAFTSLEDAGITFAETLSAGFDRVIAKLDQLIRAITDDLGRAIEDIPPVDVEVTPRWGQLPRIRAPEEEPVVFDSPLKRITGSGLAWLNPGDVAGMPELTPEFAGAFGGAMMTIINTLDGREMTRAIVPYMPGEVRRLGLTKV